MQTHQLERMLRLANKTGGKLIITDSAGNKPVVILGLDEYEALLEGAPSTDVGRSTKSERVGSIPAPRARQEVAAVAPAPVRQPIDEDEADVTAMEEALLAVEESMPEMASEEPKMVPVKVTESESEAVSVPVDTRDRSANPAGSASEFGEEQFYLEPL